MSEITEITSGLKFPEGPIALAGGSVLLVEMFGPRVTRVDPDGSQHHLVTIPGGPNGAAIGGDGAVYLCNNGGSFTEIDMGGLTFPGPFDEKIYTGGRIQRLDLTEGVVTDLYTECDGRKFRAPNDLVFDAHGGFYFTDHGIRDPHSRTTDFTGIYYAKADGSSVVEIVFPTEAPNGIGLSPDGTILYWAETHTGRVFRRRVTDPGVIEPVSPLDPWPVLCGLPGYQLLDSLAVDGAGNICVATLVNGGITVISPEGEIIEHIPTGDPLTTNICFGGDTAYITLSGFGKLVSMPWTRGGLALNH